MHPSADHDQGHMAQLLETLNTAVLLLDGGLRLLYLNPAAENLLEISRRQIKGQYWPDVVKADASLVGRLAGAVQERSSFTERALELHSATGQRMMVEFTVTPAGREELLLEITQVDRQLRVAHEELLLTQQQSARELLRGLAHEIKNPLGGLRGAAQLLEHELQQPDLKEYTQVIIGEADRLRNLVDRMLGPNNVPSRQPVNIHQILEHVRSLVDAESYHDLIIERQYDPSLPELSADPELLVQAILNIVRNAAQVGANRIILRTRAERHFTIGHHYFRLALRIEIVDDGPGIPPQLQDSVFYPMVTGRPEGTGLGLSISQTLINQHQGIIEFTSEPGNTVFTIYLPLENTNGC